MYHVQHSSQSLMDSEPFLHAKKDGFDAFMRKETASTPVRGFKIEEGVFDGLMRQDTKIEFKEVSLKCDPSVLLDITRIMTTQGDFLMESGDSGIGRQDLESQVLLSFSSKSQNFCLIDDDKSFPWGFVLGALLGTYRIFEGAYAGSISTFVWGCFLLCPLFALAQEEKKIIEDATCFSGVLVIVDALNFIGSEHWAFTAIKIVCPLVFSFGFGAAASQGP